MNFPRNFHFAVYLVSQLHVTTLPQKNTQPTQLISLVNLGSKNQVYTLFCATPAHRAYRTFGVFTFDQIIYYRREPDLALAMATTNVHVTAVTLHQHIMSTQRADSAHQDGDSSPTDSPVQPNRLAGPAQPRTRSSESNYPSH
jgi:hypothetical protein